MIVMMARAQGLLLLGTTLMFAPMGQVQAADCTAEIRPGKAPYPHIRTETPIPFHGYNLKSPTGSAPFTPYLVGDRMLEIPIDDLMNLSPGCRELKQLSGD